MKDPRAWKEEINKYKRGRNEERMRQGRSDRNRERERESRKDE
jgi:hypothetical protein